MRSSLKNILYDIGIIAVSSVLFSASVNMFITQGNIILGGATGIATVANHLFDAPIGTVILAVNAPLVLINAKLYGAGALIKTVIGIAATSAATDIFTFFPVTIRDPLLCSLFGGITMGAANGILLTRGYTTGGTDLAALIIRKRFRRLSAGRVIMICDLAVIAALTLISGNYIGIMYSLVCTYAFSATLDIIVDGASRARSVFIISEKHREIADAVTQELGRGVTVLYGHGHYTEQEKSILVCVVKKNEIYALKRVIESSDPCAFVFFNETKEVLGMGFEKE